MATSALTMSNSLPSNNHRSGFTGRLVLLMLFVAGITFWTYFVYVNQHTISKIMMTAFAALMISLVASLGARFLFYRRNWFVRLITAWASLILGLFLLGIITNWKMGFGPIVFWRNTFDWTEIAQVGGGMIVSVFALSAWWHGPALQPTHRSKASRRGSSSKKRVEPSNERAVKRPHEQLPAVARPSTNQSSLYTFDSRRSRPQRAVRLKVSKQARAITRSAPRGDKVVVGRLTKTVRPAGFRKLFRRQREMQISTHEEHRCPYCLEDVKRNDPRGVKECSICHTLHHADCWDITGMCQVPHLNS